MTKPAYVTCLLAGSTVMQGHKGQKDRFYEKRIKSYWGNAAWSCELCICMTLTSPTNIVIFF